MNHSQPNVPQEKERLAALREYALVNAPPEPALEDLTRLAATICEAPMAMISLIDADKQWLKARIGIDEEATPRKTSMCNRAMEHGDVLIIRDAAADPVFAQNPLVKGKSSVRFYAGAPLVTSQGFALGAFCVMDRVPRELTTVQLEALRILAQQATTHFELQWKVRELESSQASKAAIVEAALDAIIIINHEGMIVEFNPAAERILGHRREDILGRELAEVTVAPPLREQHRRGLAHCVATGEGPILGKLLELPAMRADGSIFPAEVSIVRRPGSAPPQFIGFLRDITERKNAEQALRASENKIRAIYHAEPQCVKLLEVDSTLHEMNVAGLELIEADNLQEVLGKPLLPILVKEEDRPAVRTMLEAVAKGESRTARFRIIGLKGTMRWLEMYGAPFHDESSNRDLILAVSRDITASKASEERFQRLNRLYAVSSGINEAIVRIADTQELYEQACKIVVEKGGMLMAWVAMEKPGTERLVPVARWGRHEGYLEHISISTNVGDAASQGPAARALKTGKLAECHDIADPREPFFYREEALRQGYRSCSAFPLKRDGRPIGLVIVYDAEPGYFEQEELRVLNALADNLSFAIESRQSEVKRREAELALRASEERFRQVAENIREVFWVTDVATRQLLYVSPVVETITGWSCEKLYAKPEAWLEMILPEDRERMKRATEEGAVNGAYDVVYQIMRPDGERRWIQQRGFPVLNTEGQVYRMVGTSEDITRRKLAEEALRVSEAQLAAAQSRARLGSWELDLTTNEGIFSSEMYRLLGMDPKLGTPPFEKFLKVVHPEDRAAVAESFTQMGKLTKPLLLEYRTDPSRGVERHLLATIHVIRDTFGEAVRAAGTLQDVTEQRGLEQQLLRAQRMESLGTLASGIAHDLNNALTPIITSLDLLRLRFPDRASHELLDLISTSAQRGADMVRQVLSFARGVEGRRVTVSVKRIIREIERIVHDTFLKNIEISAVAPDDLWPVVGDPTQLQQVLLNLCVNARDAMPNGGFLRIAARNCEIDLHEASLGPELKTGPYVGIEVCDNGAGIPPKNLEKIFDPFFTTKEAGKGTGLGLSISMGIMKSHGGCIRVESKVGEGTRFEILLPAEQTSAAAAEESPPTSLPAGNEELILVVDDEVNVRSITQRTLEMFNYRVLTASNGVEAVAIFARRHQEIALVLSDMNMPGMDGLAVIRILHQMNPKVPIVAASGLEFSNQSAELESLGVRHFLPKPFSAEALLKVLKELLAKTEG